ncbi:MAG: hypothetical protein AAF667_19870 [Pseudomonadota bacterium]
MKRRTLPGFLIFAVFALAACDAAVDEDMISATPVSALEFSDAQKAAEICGRNAPNWTAAETALKASGYLETTDERLLGIQRSQRAVILESPTSDVLVLLGSRGGEGACFVGSEGLTPQQSFELALPWVRQFGALTNEERGQGLANNAVQAWGTLTDDLIVYIAAYKTWDVLGAPGAASRLLYIAR